MRAVYCLLIICILSSCSSKKEKQQSEDSAAGLSIDGLTIFGYENNQLSYHLKSQRMLQSVDKSQLTFENFILQDITNNEIEGAYIAGQVRYKLNQNLAEFSNANFENHKNNIILNGSSIEVNLSSNILNAEGSQVLQSNQSIKSQHLTYDLLSGQITMTGKVAGEYLGGSDDE